MFICPLAVRTFITRTTIFFPGCVSSMHPLVHRNGEISFFCKTTSCPSITMHSTGKFHLWRSCRVDKYSLHHRVQKYWCLNERLQRIYCISRSTLAINESTMRKWSGERKQKDILISKQKNWIEWNFCEPSCFTSLDLLNSLSRIVFKDLCLVNQLAKNTLQFASFINRKIISADFYFYNFINLYYLGENINGNPQK